MKFSTDRDQIGLTALMIISILIMAGALVVIILPKPTTTAIQRTFQLKANKAAAATESALERTGVAQAKIQKETWKSGSQIAPQASLLVNSLAKKHNVSVTAFRPQRAINTGDIVQVPITITVQGDYADVVSLEREIEDPKTMLAVDMFQLTGIEESSSKVTGTIGVYAYLQSHQNSPKTTLNVAPGGTNVKT